jgi:hypothetical protein
MMPAGVMGNQLCANNFPGVIIDGEDENVRAVGFGNPQVGTAIVLKQFPHRADVKATERFGGFMDFRIK